MKKMKVYLSEAEWRYLLHSLNTLKTKMHNERQYTDTVDDALLKVVTAPIKRIKIK